MKKTYADELLEYFGSKEITPKWRLDANFLTEMLNNSVHFYMGDYGDVKQLIDISKYGETRLLFGKLAQDARCPYPRMTLSLSNRETYCGDKKLSNSDPRRIIKTCIMLGQDYEDELYILRTMFYQQEIGWCNFPYIIKISMSDGYYEVLKSKYANIPNFEPTTDNVFIVSQYMEIVNICLMLLNTKNIIYHKEMPPAKINKKRLKNGKQPLLEYYTLKIKQTHKYHKNHVNTESNGENSNIRLHLCKGHFKNYTPDNPLLGKITGRYWWQPHIRGTGDSLIPTDYDMSFIAKEQR